MRDFTFTVYPLAKMEPPIGTPVTQSWDAWEKEFSIREVREVKDGGCIVFGEVGEGKRRSKVNTRSSHAVGIDIEKTPNEEVVSAFEALSPFTYFVWTTHQHTPTKPRLRIVLPLAEPIEPTDYPQVWAGLNALIGGINDPNTKDVSRLSYLPSCPPGAEQHAMEWSNTGRLITVDDLPDTSFSAKAPTERNYDDDDPVTAKRFANKMQRKLRALRKDDMVKEMADLLVTGEPLASSGGRHDAICELTWWIAEKTPDATPRGLAEIFSRSLTAMRLENPGDSPSFEEVWTAYVGAVSKIEEGNKKYAQRKVDEGKKIARLQQLEAADGLLEYVDEDLERIATVNGWDLSELGDKWIIQREGMHWLLDAAGRYSGPYTEKDAAVAVSRVLARAPVRMMTHTNKGVSYRPLTDLVRERGQVAEAVISDLTRQRTTFEPETRRMYEAVCPLRDFSPHYNEELDGWLQLMAGDKHTKLIDWMSCASDLSKLLCAIYFDGTPGSGKTLLAHGMARLWTEGPPGDLSLVLSDFNDDMVRCPMLLADEQIPKKYHTDVTADLRTLISTTERTLKRKFKPATQLQGAVRLILAANNAFLLGSKDVSSNNDLNAIALRFLYINVPPEATAYLNKMPKETRIMWKEEGIARHALWLRDNHVVKNPGERFWVEGCVEEMHRMLMINSRWNALICEWLVGYLMRPTFYDKAATGLIRRGNGELLVNDKAVIDGWGLYQKNTKLEPETSKISAALRTLELTKNKRQIRNKGRPVRYRVIDVDNLYTWSDRHNIGDRETMMEAMADSTKGKSTDGPMEDFGSVPSANDGKLPF